METLFISREAQLRQHENTLQIKMGDQVRSLPIEKLSHVVLLSESRLNSRLLGLCGKHGVRLSVFDYYGYFKGAFEPYDHNPAGKVKLKQAELLLDDVRRMSVAREVVRGAAHNMLANLRYYQYRGNEDMKQPVADMQKLLATIARAADTNTLMGIEGQLHQYYYAAWPAIHAELAFGKRVRRPPNNPINCLLSFLNQLVYTVVRHEISKTHLEETFSVLHSPGYGRASLSLDLAEPFKPVLTDMLIFRMVQRRMLDDSWFEQHDNVCLLTETGRRHVAEQFSLRLEEQYQGRSFRNWIYREALGLEREVLGAGEYEAFKRRV
ncbi:CRISPR-associated endonuclease Cas1 [Thiothrix fructosivorans]|uniref:CRISPR-associated endonuclease Cas1 n=1 Tax=Thiothrix fructosivorans TaxID=111770 RepID=A0A8B0SVS0_9GAMM|nr:CRISPR-associated endonuclease Cas1 [Thiothrix fructosivorans]MBO0611507.1 CRISPR-associated endonuclease Cas1 [Thiothrix fructosivorans]QTX13072.1 CRISPR-associated endonuclease Cas1 [Thiothrix fructosivorans]